MMRLVPANSCIVCADLNASISGKKNQLCTRNVNHKNMNNKVLSDLITMKKAFPMLCAHSPSVHSYHFYIWHVFFDHWAFYMNIYWMYRRMTKYRNIFCNINIPV